MGINQESLRKIGVLILFITFSVLSNVFAKETAQEALNKGIKYAQQGVYNTAISEFTRAIEINPNDADAYNDRGFTYYKQGNFPQAISDYTKAIEISPNYAGYYSDRGVVYYAMQEYDKAWEDVHKAEGLVGYAVNLAFLSNLKKASGRDK